MQNTTQDWQETNRALFTREASMIITFNRADGKQPFVTDTDIISFSHIKNGDIFSSMLTQDKVVFTVNNRNNILDYDESEENDVYKNTQINIHEGFKAPDGQQYDSIDGGNYYISDVKRESDGTRYTFTAQTILSFMAEQCDDTITSGTAYSIANKIITQAEQSKAVPLSTITLICDYDLLSSVNVSVLRSDKLSLAVALQLIAAACGCILYVDRPGRIHIEKLGDVSEHYVMAKKFLYSPLTVEYADRIGNVTIISNHGNTSDGTSETGEKIGGRQIATIPILDDESQSHTLVFDTLTKLQNGRKRFRGKVRFDPALDLFDLIVIPNGDYVDIAVITTINATYTGAWKADISAMTVKGAILDLRICDIELLTIKQFEKLRIEQLSPNTISDIDGDYLASVNGELALWKEDD